MGCLEEARPECKGAIGWTGWLAGRHHATFAAAQRECGANRIVSEEERAGGVFWWATFRLHRAELALPVHASVVEALEAPDLLTTCRCWAPGESTRRPHHNG